MRRCVRAAGAVELKLAQSVAATKERSEDVPNVSGAGATEQQDFQRRVLRDPVDHVDARHILLHVVAEFLESRESTTGAGQCGKPRTVDPEEAQTLSGAREEVPDANVVDVTVVQPQTTETREGRVLPIVVDHGVEKPLQPRKRFVVFCRRPWPSIESSSRFALA